MPSAKLENNGKTYCIRAFAKDKYGNKIQKYKSGFASKKQAEKWATLWAEEIKQSTLNTSQSGKLSTVIANLLYEKEYIEHRAQSTLATYERSFDFIKKAFGDIDISDINQYMIQKQINNLTSTPRKCNHIKQALSILFNYALRLDLIQRSPMDKVNFPTYKAKESSYYNIEEYRHFLDILKNNHSPAYIPAILMGMYSLRPCEALALTYDDISNNTLTVNKNVTTVRRKGKSQHIVTGKTKTEKSKRSFELAQNVHDEIIEFNKGYNSAFVCNNSKGEHLSIDALEKEFEKIVDKYNLKKITPYGIRHTFGQMQKRLGTDVYTISRMMGHSNIATTTKTYFHNDEVLTNTALNSALSMVFTDN